MDAQKERSIPTKDRVIDLQSFIDEPSIVFELGRPFSVRLLDPDQDGRQVTEADSRNKAFPLVAVDESGNEVPVYAKKLKLPKLANELHCNERFMKSLSTFEIYALIRNGNEGYILTKRISGLLPFSEQNIFSIDRFLILAKAGAKAIAEMSSYGFKHKDTAPKNFAIEVGKENGVIVYDFEFSEVFDWSLSPENYIQELSFFLEHLKYQAIECNCAGEDGRILTIDELDVFINQISIEGIEEYKELIGSIVESNG